MDQRAKAQGEKKGEGTSSESGEPEEQEKGLLGSIGDFISNQPVKVINNKGSKVNTHLIDRIKI